MLEPLNRASRATEKTGADPKKYSLATGFWQLFLVLSAVAVGFCLYTATSVALFPRLAQTQCKAETILVMGAAQYNGIPSPIFQRRLDKAFDLYDQACGSSIIVTGGSQVGDNYSEGITGAAYLYSLGVPKQALLSETKSTTSYENLIFTKDLTDTRELTIVTDDLHTFRTAFLAWRLGFKAEFAPVKAQGDRWAYGFSEFVKVSAFHFGFIR